MLEKASFQINQRKCVLAGAMAQSIEECCLNLFFEKIDEQVRGIFLPGNRDPLCESGDQLAKIKGSMLKVRRALLRQFRASLGTKLSRVYKERDERLCYSCGSAPQVAPKRNHLKTRSTRDSQQVQCLQFSLTSSFRTRRPPSPDLLPMKPPRGVKFLAIVVESWLDQLPSVKRR